MSEGSDGPTKKHGGPDMAPKPPGWLGTPRREPWRPSITATARLGLGRRAKRRLHDPGEIDSCERLEHHSVDPRLGRLAQELTRAVGGDHDDAALGLEVPDALDELEAVQVGHLVVHQEEVDPHAGGEV